MNGVLFKGGTPPSTIEVRYCPAYPSFHWKVEDDRCPVCKSKIVTATYSRND